MNRLRLRPTVYQCEPMRRSQEDIEDELLILRCQDGERDALASLVARWQPRFGAFAWRLTGDRESARDVVQESWLAIVKGLRRLDDPACFRTWAYRIVRNKCADWTRRRVVRREGERLLNEETDHGDTTRAVDSEANEEASVIRQAMEELPPEQRVVLSLHYLDGMGLQAISESLGVPVGTVKSRLFLARNRLRSVLERVTS